MLISSNFTFKTRWSIFTLGPNTSSRTYLLAKSFRPSPHVKIILWACWTGFWKVRLILWKEVLRGCVCVFEISYVLGKEHFQSVREQSKNWETASSRKVKNKNGFFLCSMQQAQRENFLKFFLLRKIFEYYKHGVEIFNLEANDGGYPLF